jgi:H+/Cl- antiporter ClcA
MNYFKKWFDLSFSIIRKALRDPLNAQSLGLWSAAFITGLVSVEYARIFKFLEALVLSANDQNPYIIFAISPVCMTLACWVVRKWAPEAGGSGIPQIMAANEMDYRQQRPAVDRLLSLKVAGIKFISSLLAVAGGGAIGREGPTLQISACVFHFFGQRLRRFFPKLDSHTWIIAGSAAGLASAFNTPLGGIVYAIEEMGTLHFHRVKTPLFTSVIIAGLVSQWLLGPYLYLGFPRLTTSSFNFLPFALLSGFLSGILGALFGMGLARAVQWKRKYTSLRSGLFIAFLCGVFMATLIALSKDSVGSGTEVIGELLFHGQLADPVLVTYRFMATGISYISGAAGGIFSPSLAVGATFGSLLDQVLATGHSNLMVLLGMIGFLTGVTRTPYTSFILVLEMTDRHSAIFPMMLCALVANGAAHLVSTEGFYEIMKLRFMPSDPKVDTSAVGS